MEDEKTYMVYFDEDNQKFKIIVADLDPWPTDLGFYILHTGNILLIYLFVSDIQTKIDAGERITRKWLFENKSKSANEWFRQNNIPIKQWDGTFQ